MQRAMGLQDYAITCDEEAGFLLSNRRSLDIWNALDNLIQLLLENSSFASHDLLFAWKEHPHHLVQAREPYAWRTTLEEIKISDLVAKCKHLKDREIASLMSDKPTMLKIAGEITNSLMHSYNLRHKLTFRQCESNVPS